MAANKIQISKKENVRGNDGYKTFSIRIKESTLSELDQIAKKSNRSRNELINLFLEYGVTHCEIVE
mgnify:CR=1 FL=1